MKLKCSTSHNNLWCCLLIDWLLWNCAQIFFLSFFSFFWWIIFHRWCAHHGHRNNIAHLQLWQHFILFACFFFMCLCKMTFRHLWKIRYYTNENQQANETFKMKIFILCTKFCLPKMTSRHFWCVLFYFFVFCDFTLCFVCNAITTYPSICYAFDFNIEINSSINQIQSTLIRIKYM